MTEPFLHPRTLAAVRRYSDDPQSMALVDADLRVARLLKENDPSDEAGLISLLNFRLEMSLTDAAELLHAAAANRHACLRLIEQVQAAFLAEPRALFA